MSYNVLTAESQILTVLKIAFDHYNMNYTNIDIQVDYNKVQAYQEGSQPTLSCYLLDCKEELSYMQKRPAIIICPGGGYQIISPREAEPVAMQYLASGFHCFILNYSVQPSTYPSALLELATSVKIVREHAKKWNIDENAILLNGFSAGGHLAASLGTLWNESLFEKVFDYKQGESKVWKPNGMILGYPVITSNEFGHIPSFERLLGEKMEKLKNMVSLENQVTSNTIPTFLWHTQEDTTVPVENSFLFAFALRKQKIPFELHIYETGGHGLSLCNSTTASFPTQIVPDNENWMQLSIRWIKRNWVTP